MKDFMDAVCFDRPQLYETYSHCDLMTEIVFNTKTGVTYGVCRLGRRKKTYCITKNELQNFINLNWDYNSDIFPGTQMAQIAIILIITKWLHK